jgi:lipoprotein-anchoring transpeptidase ErfK/SrfK
VTQSMQAIERTEHVTVPTAKRRVRRRGARIAWLVLTLWLVVIAAAAGAYYGGTQLLTGNRILPGVQVMGLDLSGKTTAQAARMLQTTWDERRITLEAAGESWTLPAAQLGVMLDSDATAQQAHRQGRNTTDANVTVGAAMQTIAYLLRDYPQARQLLAQLDPRLADVRAITLTPELTFDRRQAADTLRMLAQQLEVAPQDAAITVTDGEIQTTPSVTGQAMDLMGGIGALEARIGELVNEPKLALTLPMATLTPDVVNVDALAQEVAPLLQNEITVHLWDPIKDERLTWTTSPVDLGHWISFARDENGQITWNVNEDAVGAYVTAQQETLGAERYIDRQVAMPALLGAFENRTSDVELRVHYFDRTHTVQSGETLSSIAEDYGLPYPWLMKANPDLGDQLSVGQEIIVPSQDALLPLPPIENKRIKISIAKQRMQAYEDGKLKWDWVVSTGLPDSPTSPGVYQVQSHEGTAYANQWDLYMPFFMGIYKPSPDGEVMNGFHGFPSRDNKQLLWTKNLGRPVTYGCVLLSTENAETLYHWADEGVIVEITKD